MYVLTRMGDSNLITLVQKYNELYNIQNQNYLNQQRRDNIWDEIGDQLGQTGDASAQDIDIAMKLGAGFPMGPLELADFTGLDTKKFVLGIMSDKTGHPVFRPIPLLDKLVKEGKYGRKSREGFYKYEK